jgi:3-hydroxymyristoyl/3-hydroxydecanoyl-(acyl carrier protein) dehydratase/malonyl CoA-acyl carrier protein transacylase
MVSATTAHAYLSTALLREGFGVHPSMAFGYSIGEAVMLRALGAWPERFEANVARWSAARLGERLAGTKEAVRAFWSGRSHCSCTGWQTYALFATPERISAVLQDEPCAFLTMINTPGEVCIAGDPAACARVIARLGCAHSEVPFNYVFHSPPTHSAYADLLETHRNPTRAVPGITFYTGATNAPLILDEDEVAQAIAMVICRLVDFPRLVRRAYADGARIFVEPGPAGACSRWIDQILGDQEHVTVPLDVRGADGGLAVFRGLARLISHRVPVGLTALDTCTSTLTAQARTRTLMRTITLGGTPLKQALAEVQLSWPGRSDTLPVAQEAPMTALDSLPHTLEPPFPPQVSASSGRLLRALGAMPVDAGSLSTPTTRVHVALLQARSEALDQTRMLIAQQLDVLCRWQSAASAAPVTASSASSPLIPHQQPVWDQADLLEFAQGSIGAVFGSAYAEIDGYRRRVRLPIPPYLLVSRVLAVEGVLGEFRPSRIVTEYDIPRGAWYAVDGQPPQAIVVESGQCDLLLISYLGVDLALRGERVYRLLDATMTYHGDLPREGQTLHFDIQITSFAQSGQTLLFFFRYDCFVDGRLLLTLEHGCAGFFTDVELASGRGVVGPARHRRAGGSQHTAPFIPLLVCEQRQFDREQLLALSAGNLVRCFGPAYAPRGRNRSLRLPPPAILLLDRICHIDLRGGAWGFGAVEAEKDLRPDDWYFTAHFKDDPVLAGSLIAEGCAQLLQFYLLYLGLQTRTRQARFQPLHGLAQSVQCRGQVTPGDGRLKYRMDVIEIGLAPAPYAVATVDVLVGERIVVRFEHLGLRLAEEPPVGIGQGMRSGETARGGEDELCRAARP